MKTKSPSESSVIMREMVMPGDANKHGTIFGGKIMSWIDIAAAMAAERHCNNPVVTAHISDIDFISPINVGHHVTIKASINYVGRSSMIVGVRVDSENPYSGDKRKTTKAYVTFVAIDEFGKSREVAGLEPQTDDEKRRYENAKARAKSKKEFNSSLKR
ncbi:MAG: acyl-CoA thioesterase [Bacteriovoracaceae bacterium]|nr:acyl-CoA thioesterase [Bacteriovoracaceae bacterium]